MQHSMLIGLIQNTAILLVFSMLYDYMWKKNEEKHKLSFKILTGLIISGATIILMSTPWELSPGIFFDTRSIILAITGLFFGPIPTFVAVLVTALYRFYIGGDGVAMGIAVIVASGTIGWLWNKLRPQWRNQKKEAWELLFLGILVHVVMLMCTILLPSEKFMVTIKAIAIPLIIIYSPGTMLLGLLMIRQSKNWENQKAKDKLLEADRWFTELLQNMQLLSVIIDKNGYITFANQYLLEKTGYTYLELIGNSWFDVFIAPRDKEQVKKVFEGLIVNEEDFTNNENEIVLKNGNKILVVWNNTLLRDENDQIIGTASIGEIIQEQKLQERKKLQFATILESSLNEIYVFNAQSLYYSYVNFGALKNLGYSLEQIKMLTPLDIMKDFTEKSFRDFTHPLEIENEKILVFETTHSRMDGSLYPVEVYLQVFYDSGTPIFLAVVQDISERKKHERELIDAIQKSEESDKLKTLFLASLSHEIRTPLNSIVGFTNLLIQKQVDEDKISVYQDIIAQSINKLLAIINNLVDMSKIETNQLSIRVQPFNLYNLFENIYLYYNRKEFLVLKPDLTFEIDIPKSSESLQIISDGQRLKQVMDNLLLNAIKYTDSGKIIFGYQILDYQENPEVKFFVHDSGIGIPEDKKNI